MSPRPSALTFIWPGMSGTGGTPCWAHCCSVLLFTIDSSFYYHFLDVIALFPFLLVSLDGYWSKPFAGPVFIFCTFLLALTNYYFLLEAPFSFSSICFSGGRKAGRTGRRFSRRNPAVRLRALLASFMLLPSALTLLETSKASESFGGLTRFLALLPQIPMLIKGLILPHGDRGFRRLFSVQ